MHWLIAEDEADIRNLVSMMAQVWGHTTVHFESGTKLWDWLAEVEAGKHTEELPQFALMDIRMPGKRGNELSKRMREIDKLRNIPVVLMTAFVMSEEEMNQMRVEYGVDYVINKPLPDFDRLKTILDNVIKSKAS